MLKWMINHLFSHFTKVEHVSFVMFFSYINMRYGIKMKHPSIKLFSNLAKNIERKHSLYSIKYNVMQLCINEWVVNYCEYYMIQMTMDPLMFTCLVLYSECEQISGQIITHIINAHCYSSPNGFAYGYSNSIRLVHSFDRWRPILFLADNRPVEFEPLNFCIPIFQKRIQWSTQVEIKLWNFKKIKEN